MSQSISWASNQNQRVSPDDQSDWKEASFEGIIVTPLAQYLREYLGSNEQLTPYADMILQDNAIKLFNLA